VNDTMGSKWSINDLMKLPQIGFVLSCLGIVLVSLYAFGALGIIPLAAKQPALPLHLHAITTAFSVLCVVFLVVFGVCQLRVWSSWFLHRHSSDIKRPKLPVLFLIFALSAVIFSQVIMVEVTYTVTLPPVRD
jgi:hypothetical protein